MTPDEVTWSYSYTKRFLKIGNIARLREILFWLSGSFNE